MLLLMSRVLGVLLLCSTLTARAQDAPPWEAMDYGPFLSAAIEVEPGNIAYKGIAVTVGDTPEGEATMLFDTDVLRWAAGWRGGGVDLRGIVYDGPHGIHPGIDGEPDWSTNTGPGVSVDGDFADLRAWPYGPIDGQRMRWEGIHVKDDDLALRYRVGQTEIREQPGLVVKDGLSVYTRGIEYEGTDAELMLGLLKAPRESLQWLDVAPDPSAAAGAPDHFAVVVRSGQELRQAIGIVEATSGEARVVQQGPDIRLVLNPGKHAGPARVLVAVASIEDEEELETFTGILRGLSLPKPFADFSVLPQDQWIPSVATSGQTGYDPFSIDDSIPIVAEAGAPARNIALKAASSATMGITAFNGTVRTDADVPVDEAYAWASVTSNATMPGPVASWTFDEGEGEAMRNEVTGRRDLELDGVTWRRGLKGRCLDFDGTARATWSGNHMDFTRSDLTFAAWIYTTADGTIMSKTRPEGEWVPDGVTFFVREGRLAFDVGWVGVVHGSTNVADGSWHHVAFNWSHHDGAVRLYVDGREEASGTLPVGGPVDESVVQLGFTAENFPSPTWFSGFMEGVQVFHARLDEGQLSEVAGQTGAALVQAWLVRGEWPGATWRRIGGGDVVLHLPSEPDRREASLLTWSGPEPNLDDAITRLRGLAAPVRDAFTVDLLTRPEENPWDAWMRFGAVDFLPGTDAAVVSTWSGDVWLVEGLDDPALEELTWTRIASGLSQPLGLRVRDGEIFVLGRDQITRLRDLNGDWVTDFYENFNNDTMNSEHFHEPASGLQTDAAGHFYYLKAARHAKDAIHPHHGTLVKVEADGSRSTILASGFRAPNGLAVEPDGAFFGSDQEGHWMPANRLNRITDGGFYGNNWTGTPMTDLDTYDPPLAWVHPTVDRSPSSQIRVTTPAWGDLNGRLLGLSYGTGEIYLILEDEIDGLHQGGVVKLPIQVPTGLMSARFNPTDGHLYACGLVGWSSDGTVDGGLYRVRSTGPLPPLPDDFRAVNDGLVLHFTQPLDPTAADPDRWDLKAWNYKWTARYGSPEFKLNGDAGRTNWPVTKVHLSPDRRTVWLQVPDMSPAMQVHVDYAVPVGGSDHEGYAHLTVHQLAPESGRTHVDD
ncbi:MAG: hypothetical protein MK116_00585 [Phycisphaerales bacterium]|nr:hypothetical protein [Phycisphaerales bacterium]